MMIRFTIRDLLCLMVVDKVRWSRP